MPLTSDVFTTKQLVKSWLKIPANQTAEDDALQLLATAVSNDFLTSINRQSILLNAYSEIRDGNGKDRMVLRQFPVANVNLVQIEAFIISPYNPFSATQAIQTGFIGSNYIAIGGYVNDQYTVSLQGYRFTRGRMNVKFQYSGGFGNFFTENVSVPAGSPFQITVPPVSGSTYNGFVDLGVQYVTSQALFTAVTTPTTAGQYSVNPQTGVYTFSVADAGAQVTIDWGLQLPPYDVVQSCTEWAAYRYRSKEWVGQKSVRTETGLQTTYDGDMPKSVKETIDLYRRRGMAGS
jgi:hypothetical protein